MKIATVRLFWNRSISDDVLSQALKINVNGEIKVDVSLPSTQEEFVFDVSEKSQVNVSLVAKDAANVSDAAVLDFQVDDLTAPAAPTGLFYEITNVRDEAPAPAPEAEAKKE